jgi:3-methyladenine DNA glycosylase AlkD
VDSSAWVAALQAQLAASANPAQAPAMQAYMKSAMPFLGLATPARRQVVAAFVVAHPLADSETLKATAMALWRSATHRELRYAALDLLRITRHKRWLDFSWLPLLQEMLVSSPWWDHNDEISGLALGVLLQRHPAQMKPVLRAWAHGDNLWLRRAAMLAQRSLKTGFDAVLLYDCILPSLPPYAQANEFFIRKGMGWALRERSYDAPDEVQAFCSEYAGRLSPLTVREALKVLNKRSASTEHHPLR